MCFRQRSGRAFLSALFIPIMVASCTVKEQRTECPCLLTLLLDNLPSHPVQYCLLQDGQLLSEGQALCDTSLTFPVPRRGVELRVRSGGGKASDTLQIPYGSPCPPVYLYRRLLDTGADAVRVQVRLSKHFCLLGLELEGPPGNGEPFWTQVRGQVNGLGPDGRPQRGDFSCRLDPGGAVCLPRQSPADPLWLDITTADGTLRTFSLGAALQEAGYDWTSPDLQDADLLLQLSVTHLQLLPGGISRTIPLNVEI